MNYSNSCVNFTGSVDKSVYEWAKIAKREAKEAEITNANFMGRVAEQKDLDEIDKNTDKLMKVLEQKAAAMHPDTVITIDQPTRCRDRFLCVHNDKLKTELRETPWSKTNNDRWGKLDRWQVAGCNADKEIGGYDGPRGKDTLKLLEKRINDIDETKTDKYLFNQAVDYAVKCSESGSSKYLEKQVANIVSVQKDLGFKSDFVECVDANRKKADEKRELWRQNEEIRKNLDREENPGFFQRIRNFFS